jgi:uncharacterized protein (DUF2267 family)
MTTTTHIRTLDHSVETTNVWLADLADELGTSDRMEAYRVLRAFLHTLRDRLTAHEAADLSAQLPVVIRGIYFQDWRPRIFPRIYRDRSEFLRRFAEEAGIEGESSISFAAEAATRVLRRHVSAGEIDDILAVLPTDVRELLDALTVHASS